MSGFPLRPHSSTSASRRPDIPLTVEPEVDTSSIGSLVKDATVHMSTLVRSEIELAKMEITQSVKTGLRGAIFFIAAALIGVVALVFGWFVLAEILNIWLPRWAAFLIVLGIMFLAMGGLVFLGIKKIKQVKKPERTIQTLSDTAQTLKAAATHSPATTPGN
ncbi:phage holin family protein [Nakamurella sp. YIM 132087]|uniref:Phage holin family protein n=1 Tax=Nakamurella alba TaxID=2665158 RepID=A0A7K1FSD1_9ACTN|nr:phage holin family protein [Nakamurella alba]MTD17057.1 phage holin family protein [Nakamurella alba]